MRLILVSWIFFALSASTICAQHILKINFDPQTPAFLKQFQDDERKALSRGPFKHEPLTGSSIREYVYPGDLEAVLPLISQLQRENPNFSVTDQEFLLSYVLSRILSEQTKAYAKFPWIRTERISFARARLDDFAYSYPTLTGRMYFMTQQLTNRLGLFVDWKSITKRFQKIFQASRAVKVKASDDHSVVLNIANERELMEGLFTPGNFMIAVWAMNVLIRNVDAPVESAEFSERLDRMFRALEIRDYIDDRLIYNLALTKSATTYPLSWAYSSSSVGLEHPQNFDTDSHIDFSSSAYRLLSLVEKADQLANQLSDETGTRLILRRYIIDQILSRSGSNLTSSQLDFSIEFLFENMSFLKREKTGQGEVSVAGVSLSQFRRDEGSPLTVDFLKFIIKHSKLDNVLEGLGVDLGLGSKLASTEAHLRQMSQQVVIDWEYRAVDLQAYKPKQDQKEAPFRFVERDGICSLCDLMGIIKDLESEIHRRWYQEGLDSFENSYHYLNFTGGMTVDYSYVRHDSRTWKYAKAMQEGSDIVRLPMTWEPIQLNFEPDEMPYTEEGFRDAAYDHLNRIYIQKIQTKILRLWGADFDPRYRSDMNRTDAHFHNEIVPRYEALIDDRFHKRKVAFSVLQLKIPDKMPMLEAHERLWEVFDEKAEAFTLQKAAESFRAAVSEGLSKEEAREQMKKALESGVRQEAFDLFGAELAAALGTDQAPRIHHLDPISGGRAKIIASFQQTYLTPNRTLTAEGAFDGYENKLKENKLLTFPIYVRPPDTAAETSRGGELFVVLVRSYEDLGTIGLYDAQIEVREEIEHEKAMKALVGLVSKLLGGAIWEINSSSTWIGSSATKRGEDFVAQHVDSRNLQTIARLAAEIEHFRIAQAELWHSRRWIPRRVRDGGIASSITKSVGR